jgi:hypothetical protein
MRGVSEDLARKKGYGLFNAQYEPITMLVVACLRGLGFYRLPLSIMTQAEITLLFFSRFWRLPSNSNRKRLPRIPEPKSVAQSYYEKQCAVIVLGAEVAESILLHSKLFHRFGS